MTGLRLVYAYPWMRSSYHSLVVRDIRGKPAARNMRQVPEYTSKLASTIRQYLFHFTFHLKYYEIKNIHWIIRRRS